MQIRLNALAVLNRTTIETTANNLGVRVEDIARMAHKSIQENRRLLSGLYEIEKAEGELVDEMIELREELEVNLQAAEIVWHMLKDTIRGRRQRMTKTQLKRILQEYSEKSGS